MKILIDARLYGPEHTGNGRYTMNLIQSLSKIDKVNSYIVLLKKEKINEVNLPDNWTKVEANFKHYTFTEQVKLPFLISKYKPDICHFPHFNVPIFYFGKYIVTIHDLIMHKSRGGEATTRSFPIYQLWRLGYYISFAKAVYGSTKIIVPTNYVKDDLCSYYNIDKSKVNVAYEGIDMPKEQKTFNTNELGKYFVYVGNAYPHKNLERLIKSIALLNKDIKEKIILAISSSRNVFTDRLKLLAQKNEVSEYVRLLGYVPDGELFSLYSKSVGFVYPTLIEGFGLPGLEAMASGTPVIASDIPVLKEVYEDNAEYFNPLNIDSMALSMKKTLSLSQEKRQRIINKAKEFIKKYSWDKMASRTLETYKSLK